MPSKVLFSSRSLPAALYGDTYDAISTDWAAWCVRAEVTPFILPNREEFVAPVLAAVNPDYVILTGGNNIAPSRYGIESIEGLSDVSEARDATELKLIEHSLLRRIPVLGVCRGMQLLNVFFGGQIKAPGTSGSDYENHAGTQHAVTLTLPRNLSSFPAHEIQVNSYHRQLITEAELAKPLRSFATSPDGVIEGLYHPSAPVIGLQWHPERQSPSTAFDDFLVKQIRSIS